MLKPAQARMARAALNWSLLDVQERTGVNKNTVVRFEAGKGVLLSTATKLEEAFTKEGIVFMFESEDRIQGVGISRGLSRKLEAQSPRTRTPKSGKRSQKSK